MLITYGFIYLYFVFDSNEALAKLCISAGSTEPWLLFVVISTKISHTCIYNVVTCNYSKTCVKWPLKNEKNNKYLNDKW